MHTFLSSELFPTLFWFN